MGVVHFSANKIYELRTWSFKIALTAQCKKTFDYHGRLVFDIGDSENIERMQRTSHSLYLLHNR